MRCTGVITGEMRGKMWFHGLGGELRALKSAGVTC